MDTIAPVEKSPGWFILRARTLAGLSRRELARRAGTSAATLAAYEAGRKAPSLETLTRILDAGGFSLQMDILRKGQLDLLPNDRSSEASRAERHDSIKVLVADAQLLFADSLATVLGQMPGLSVLGERPDSAAATIDAVARRKPQVALIDYWLEGIKPWALIQALLRRDPELKVLHLAWFYGPAQVEDSLAAGAVGFLPKSIPVTKVHEAIHRSWDGERPVLGQGLGRLVAQIKSKDQLFQRVRPGVAALTPRELAVLRHLASGSTIVEIARLLGIKSDTVRKHIESILRKTQARSQLEAVAIARDFGIIS